MTDPLVLPYLGTLPQIGSGGSYAAGSVLIGRVIAGDRLLMGKLASFRADGHDIRVGDDCRFLDRATIHIADSVLPTTVGDRVDVGRFALVHACELGDDCVLGDAAVIMDGSSLGAGSVLAAGALVPPRKQLEGGWLYQGNPAKALRRIDACELQALRRALIAGQAGSVVTSNELPPLDMSPFLPLGRSGPCFALGGKEPRVSGRSYIAPTAVVAGEVDLADDTSVWFACVLRANFHRIRIGARSNVQDNSLLLAETGDIVIGSDVTVGHNVRMRSCVIEDEALIGMGCEMGDGVIVRRGGCVAARSLVEPGTEVAAGDIWAGRPAQRFRPMGADEHAFFQRGKDVYVRYTQTYLAA
jgi:carbonic anhydrase/acetyltransferase-like protein (isoleucine patch superfamily)